jgi:hypothetical protein
MDRELDWTAGYVTELEYTFGYYRELCPGMLRLACLSAGIRPPTAKPLHYLELGFGQGVSINIHAAAIPGEFWGADFNPAQVAHARSLAEASGSGARLSEDSFAEFAARPDLPEFDIIGMHGVWTWISDENSGVVIDLIRRKLRAGGILYISYNCLPGWAPSMPLRHLVKLHADFAAEATGMLAKLNEALTFAQRVIDSGASFFRGNPAVAERLKMMSKQDRNYLAHEYFTHDWRVMPFSDMARWLDDAKLSFGCSADLIGHLDQICLSTEGQKLLAEIKHPILKESVRDYFINQQFRRDIFVKGPRRFAGMEQVEVLRSEAFVLTTHADEVPLKVRGPLGEATLNEQVYRPIIAAMAEDNYAAKKIEQLAAHDKLKSLQVGQIVQSLLVLTGMGHTHPAQDVTSASQTRCNALNQYVLQRARNSAEVAFMASPVTGGAVYVPRFHQLFLLALQAGKKTAAEQADFAWRLNMGQRIIKDGKIVESAEENIAYLKDMADVFASKRLPILKALEVV